MYNCDNLSPKIRQNKTDYDIKGDLECTAAGLPRPPPGGQGFSV